MFTPSAAIRLLWVQGKYNFQQVVVRKLEYIGPSIGALALLPSQFCSTVHIALKGCEWSSLTQLRASLFISCILVNIPACHARDWGLILRRGATWRCRSGKYWEIRLKSFLRSSESNLRSYALECRRATIGPLRIDIQTLIPFYLGHGWRLQNCTIKEGNAELGLCQSTIKIIIYEWKILNNFYFHFLIFFLFYI